MLSNLEIIGRGRRPSPIWQSEEFFELPLILTGIYYFKISSVSKLMVNLDRYPN